MLDVYQQFMKMYDIKTKRYALRFAGPWRYTTIVIYLHG